ncbi:hypothetical protein Vadar_033899 [Vaccinium darrowii]|uniref:Uncharacterized protein n=1 Tax=Vaccinium darrowii TaxID=229202 RepID=A0ACB7Z114_9ERIC|nr:hypothetical protein Vadar_033899 [Vaccinium darrowii]
MSFRGIGQTNASSGMGVADHCKSTYLELQRKKVHRYVIFKIDEKKKEVVVEKTGGPAESYDDFTASLPENDCRYAVYDYDFVTSENCQKSKIFFFAWSPSVSRIRAKMLYATSKERFRREFEGIHYEIQATDPTEMDLEVLQDHLHVNPIRRRCRITLLIRNHGRMPQFLLPSQWPSSHMKSDLSFHRNLFCPGVCDQFFEEVTRIPRSAPQLNISSY